MAERKSVNKYYPPDWDPSKGSVNKYVGQHPLRDRARKLSQGILVIRFELPYNIWCGGCNAHVGMGVRYNAEKTKVGNYYTTPIYKFRMKCHLCDNYFEIQTDPKNHDYVILCGARRKEQRWDPKENEQIVPEDKATHKKLATDAMYKLEHGSDDKQKGKSVIPTIWQISEERDVYKDDYIINKIAREKFRNEKKAIKATEMADKELLLKSSLDIKLVKESEEDKQLAGLLKLKPTETYDQKQLQKRKEIESRSIFEYGKPKDETNCSKGDNIKQLAKSIALQKGSPFDLKKSVIDSSSVKRKELGIRKRSLENADKGPETISNKISKETESSTVDNRTYVDESDSEREKSKVTNFNKDDNFCDNNMCDQVSNIQDVRCSDGPLTHDRPAVNALGLAYSDSDTDSVEN